MKIEKLWKPMLWGWVLFLVVVVLHWRSVSDEEAAQHLAEACAKEWSGKLSAPRLFTDIPCPSQK